MLLFILQQRQVLIVAVCFNTSHVTLYRIWKSFITWIIWVSIHLMLLFIWDAIYPGARTGMFQYISCYSLSWNYIQNNHITNSFQYISCYSLSALIQLMTIFGHAFQYISCYSLSWAIPVSFASQYWFQYISCYSLSSQQKWSACILRSFNTSHVTLYRE